MGMYLFTGICTDFQIHREGEWCEEEVVAQLGDWIDLSLFDRNDGETQMRYTLKPRLLEEGFAEFLEAQFKVYGEMETNEATLEMVRSAKSGLSLLEMARNANHCDFFGVGGREWLQANYLKRLEISFGMLAFFMDGKISMERYNSIFGYFTHYMRSQRSLYPIAGAMKTIIYG